MFTNFRMSLLSSNVQWCLLFPIPEIQKRKEENKHFVFSRELLSLIVQLQEHFQSQVKKFRRNIVNWHCSIKITGVYSWLINIHKFFQIDQNHDYSPYSAEGPTRVITVSIQMTTQLTWLCISHNTTILLRVLLLEINCHHQQRNFMGGASLVRRPQQFTWMLLGLS